MAVLAPIPSIVHTVHETDLGCAARSTRASRGGHPRDVDPCRCESEDNAPEHRDEAEDSDDDQLCGDPRHERTDSDEHDDRAGADTTIAARVKGDVRMSDVIDQAVNERERALRNDLVPLNRKLNPIFWAAEFESS